eukprot:TRINITY_DN5126_c0_g1_i1.p1 TRINITY_DN5126_c0_g1~~TRINITY_DN5126_c0_g1_i1.p1  ORF type:complete len:1311 (-),score=359.83 TRINITY_DN5126_c0_g1_i1:86-4018(-)
MGSVPSGLDGSHATVASPRLYRCAPIEVDETVQPGPETPGPETPGTAGCRMPDSPPRVAATLEPLEPDYPLPAIEPSPTLSAKLSSIDLSSPDSYRKWKPKAVPIVQVSDADNIVRPTPINFSTPRLPRLESFDAIEDAARTAARRRSAGLQAENASLSISAANTSINLNVPFSEASRYSQRRLSRTLGLSSSASSLAPALISRLHDGLKLSNTRQEEVEFNRIDAAPVRWWQTRVRQHNASEVANKFTFRFEDSDVEQAYNKHQFVSRIAQIRVMSLVTILLTIPYFIADYFYSHDDIKVLVITRYAGFLPVQLLMTALIWSQYFQRVSQQGFMFVFCLVLGASFLVSGCLSSQFKVFYFESIAWALIFGFVFLGVKTVFAIWLFLLFVPALIVDAGTTFRILFIHQVVYQVAFFVFYSYVFERRMRGDFLLARIYEKEEARLKKERKFADDLLLNILPKPIADRVRHKQEVIADGYKSCTVMFAKVTDLGSRGFDDSSGASSPAISSTRAESFPFLSRPKESGPRKTQLELFTRLNELFILIDQQLDKFPGVEKIKTMGESYMAAAGVPVQIDNHPELIVEFALDIVATVAQYNMTHGTNVGIRIGIHTGPVVAGVIGNVKFVYDMWGDTCNVASRMESTSQKGQIQITGAVKEALGKRFSFEQRTVNIKGKGAMEAFFVTGVGSQTRQSDRFRLPRSGSKRKISSKASWSVRAIEALTSGVSWPSLVALRRASRGDLVAPISVGPVGTMAVPDLMPSATRTIAHRWMARTSKVSPTALEVSTKSIVMESARQLGERGSAPPPPPPPTLQITPPVIVVNSTEDSPTVNMEHILNSARSDPESKARSEGEGSVTEDGAAPPEGKEATKVLNLLTLSFVDPAKEALFTQHRARTARKIAKSSLVVVLIFHLISAPLTDMFILFGGLTAPSDPDNVMVKYVVIKGVTLSVYGLLVGCLSRWPQIYVRHPVATDFTADALHLAFACIAGGLLSPQFFWGAISSMFFIFLFTKLRFLFSVPLGLLGYGIVKVLNLAVRMNFAGNESVTFNSVFVALLLALILSQYISEYKERQTFYVNCNLEDNRAKIKQAKEKSEELLLNILPAEVVVNLKTQKPAPEEYADVSVLCADIVGFTAFCSDKSPVEVVEQLNVIFSMFDKLVTDYAVEKIKTIGDAYIVAAGLPVRTQNHATTICLLALDMQSALNQFNKNRTKLLQMRIGIHSGSCVAGLVGAKKFFYDVFGDAISVATIAETNSAPGCVLITEDCKTRIQSRVESPPFGFVRRDDPIDAKRRGKMNCYFLSLPEHDDMATAV